MDTPLMEGRLGSLDTQSEAGAGGLGAEAAQGGHFWRVRKASSAPRGTTLKTRFALPSATPPNSMPAPPAPAAPRPDLKLTSGRRGYHGGDGLSRGSRQRERHFRGSGGAGRPASGRTCKMKIHGGIQITFFKSKIVTVDRRIFFFFPLMKQQVVGSRSYCWCEPSPRLSMAEDGPLAGLSGYGSDDEQVADVELPAQAAQAPLTFEQVRLPASFAHSSATTDIHL
jgi:hypothetical protein